MVCDTSWLISWNRNRAGARENGYTALSLKLSYRAHQFALPISGGESGRRKFRRSASNMNIKREAGNGGRWMERVVGMVLLLSLSLATAGIAVAQKKKKQDDTPPPSIMSSLPDEQKIDYVIGQMLGAWQIGDIDQLHKYLADDVSVVAGTWTPPAIGWTNYLLAYQAQRARTQQVRLERSNTLIRIAPSKMVAWVCYQWQFTGLVDGSPSASEGQTTLILEKRGDDWIIVHNHTSLIHASQPAAPASAAPQTAEPAPAKP